MAVAANKGIYKVELWYKGQQRIGNIRRMTQNLRWVKKLNGVYSIDFSLDTQKFLEYCKSIGENPRNVLWPLLTDVRIKVRDTYVIGAHVVGIPPNFNKNNATIQVSCDGFLILPGRRHITKNYASMFTGNIIKDALDVKQSVPNGDMGIVFDPTSYLGQSGTRQDTYVDQNIQELIVNRSSYITDPFDFEFAPDRKLKLYQRIGNLRPDTVVTYPGVKRTIKASSMSMKHTGTDVANQIIALGSGFGLEALRYVADDFASQLKYGIIEDIVVFNNVTNIDTLADHAHTELEKRKETLILPTATVSGMQYKTDERGIGDTIIMSQDKYSLYSMDGLHRVNEMSVSVGANDDEDIKLTVDNYGI